MSFLKNPFGERDGKIIMIEDIPPRGTWPEMQMRVSFLQGSPYGTTGGCEDSSFCSQRRGVR